jgi:CubicO group peptidase (beta-lactamase class C family)
MLLVESGQLDLGEPVGRWLPEGPPQWRQVTLAHLLSHTAGIPQREVLARGVPSGLPVHPCQRSAPMVDAPRQGKSVNTESTLPEVAMFPTLTPGTPRT